MKILLIKISSMGDIIHTLPALTDAMEAIPNITIDWVVDPAFTDIASRHPAVRKILPATPRKWKKNIFSPQTWKECCAFIKSLNAEKYDVIIDAQSLLKTAIISRLAKGEQHGLDKYSAREKIASLFYKKKHAFSPNQNVIARGRELFAKALNYTIHKTADNFLLDQNELPSLPITLEKNYFVFLHSTTWENKHYPDHYWKALITKCHNENIPVYLPWGTPTEKARAEILALNHPQTKVLPKLSFLEMMRVINDAAAIVTVDTGLGHLAAALKKPTILLCGPTNGSRLKVTSGNQLLLQAVFPCAPCNKRTCSYAKSHKTEINPACFTTIGPDIVWKYLAQYTQLSLTSQMETYANPTTTIH